MQLSRKLAPLSGLAALGLLTTVPALAQSPTILSGHHDGNKFGDGYDTGTGTYIVNSTGAPPTTTFDNNSNNGLYAGGSTVTITGGAFDNNKTGLYADSGSTVTVNGGAFDNNGYNGLSATDSTVTITGGAFNNNNNGLDAYGCTVTITGGAFNNNNNGLNAELHSTVTVTGGTFTGNGADLVASTGSAITLYGSFTTQTLGSGSGTFTGTLENNASSPPQKFSYQNFGTGVINLVNVPNAVPEPSSIASFAIGGLGLMGLALKARKRRVA